MFTDFLIIVSITVAIALAGLLIITSRRPTSGELRHAAGPLVLTAMTLGLIALGFLVN
jgi:hypothetical protein